MTVAAPTVAATAPGLDGEIVASVYTGEYRVFTLNPGEVSPALASVKAGIGTVPPGTAIHPTWSPDGRIAYAAADQNDTSRRQRIFTILADGTERTLLTSNSASDTQPAWSPNGNRIAFTTRIGGGTAACSTGSSSGSKIVYGADGDIYTIAPDGTGAADLTNTPSSFEGGPRWKPDGSKIGFWRQGGSGVAAMWEMTPTGSSPVQLADNGGVDQFGPEYSPAGNKVLFIGFAGGGDPEIFVRDLPSGAPVQLTNNDAIDTSARWSCDGSKIVFASNRAGNYDIFTMPAAGGAATNLTHTAWNENDPAFSPDGTKIAMDSDQHGDYDVMVMQANGSNASSPTHLTTSSASDINPSWSPDGTKLTFASNRGGNSDIYKMSATTPDSETAVTHSAADEYEPNWGPSPGDTYIYTMKRDGTDPQKVTLPIDGGDPAWSPDGARLAFSDHGDLFTIQPDGLGLSQLTADHNGTVADSQPSYSPDGTKVVYVGSDASGHTSLYTVNVNGGTGLLNVTQGTNDSSPVWSPSGSRIAFVRDGNLYTIQPDGRGLTLIKDISPGASFISLDWSNGGPPNTLLTKTPGDTVGTGEATFRFTATRFPATFECRLTATDNNKWPGLHDWQDCGSMAKATSTQPTRSYNGIPRGHYTFYVRASNDHGADPSPASQQFDAFPPELVVVKDGTGFGTVTSDPRGINCRVADTECRSGLSGPVTLTAKPDVGSVFKGWSDGCTSSQRTCKVTIGNKPVFAHARFEIDPNGVSCDEAPVITKKVGSWYIRGCLIRQGNDYITHQPFTLNGITMVPIGGTVLIDTGHPRLYATNELQVMAGPASSGGRTLGPFVLQRDEFDYDLNQTDLLLSTPNDTLLGLPVLPIAAAEAHGPSATISMVTNLPDVLGSGDALVQFITDRDDGLRPGSFRVGRLVEAGTSKLGSPFDAVVGGFFPITDTTMSYEPGDGWHVDGTLDNSNGGKVGGYLRYSAGKLSSGNLVLRNVPIAGLASIAELDLQSDGNEWTMSTPATASRQAAAAAAAGKVTCAGAVAKKVSKLKFDPQKNPFDALKLLSFNLTIPHCELYGDIAAVDNLNIRLVGVDVVSIFPPRSNPKFAISGTLTGRATGDFTGEVALDVVKQQPSRAHVDMSAVQIDKLLKLSDFALDWTPMGNSDHWVGHATLTDTGSLVDADLTTTGGQLSKGTLKVDRLALFTVHNTVTGNDDGVIEVRNFSLGYVPAARHWDVAGDVSLPGGFASGLTGSVDLDTNGNVQSGDLRIGQATLLGYIQVNNFHLTFTGPGDWSGDGSVVLPGIIEVGANIAFKAGELSSIGADLQFGQPIPIVAFPFTGVYRVQFSLNKDPLQLLGGLGFQAGPTLFGIRPITAGGALTLRFPGHDQNPGFRVEGGVRLMNLLLGQGWVDYSTPISLDIGGCIGDCDNGLTLGPATITGEVRGQMQSSPFAFQVSGAAGAAINLPTPTFLGGGVLHVGVTGRALLSNLGIAVCGQVDGWGAGVAVGMGYKWGGSPAVFHGCDLGAYGSISNARALVSRRASRVASAAAVTALNIVVPEGLPVESFRFVGTDAPPLVDLHRPNGQTISVSAGTLGAHGDVLVTVDEDTKETYILVNQPETGTWTVSLQSGSSALSSASSAEGLVQPEVDATVTGDAAARTLTWELTPLAGQEVQFIETGDGTSHLITKTSEATGSMQFIPALGPAGTRTITAEVIQDGLPRDSIEVATYEAPERQALIVNLAGSGTGTVSSTPAGIACGTTCAMLLGSNSVSLRAAPATGSVFVGWSGSCGGTGVCTVPAGATAGVTATFVKIPAPKISRIKPGRAEPGDRVTIRGSGFFGATTVRFGKVRARKATVVSAGRIAVTVPKKAHSGRVFVTTPGGTARSERFVVVRQRGAR